MSITEFIRESILRPRMKGAGCLVIYDPNRRYREICLAMRSESVCVVDASESSIESREAALKALRDLATQRQTKEGVLVYVPTLLPQDDDAKQKDPFALYLACGSMFPKDDGDDYLSLCLREKPDHATEIRKVFSDCGGEPGFAVIDAIGGGAQWPQLRSILGAESARELLTALLVPSVRQREALKVQEGWVSETRVFLETTLGLNVKTRGKTWDAVATELWRFLLFSEFAFDLPVQLPASLKDVPHALQEARPIIDDVCDALRRDPRHHAAYIDRAEAIEAELQLATHCEGIEDLGERDTFPFEERTFLRTAIKGLCAGEVDPCRKVLATRRTSVWLGKGESQAQWEVIRTALALVEACEDLERQLPEKMRALPDLLDFYTGFLREADRLHREFEQAVGECLDVSGMMAEVLTFARSSYRGLSEKVQTQFVRLTEAAGWPPTGRLQNAQVFDRFVADRLKDSGRRVAFLMVDALRYELGVALEKLLSEDGPVELAVAYAQLPTITLVGMASLLPGAHADLRLSEEGGSLMLKLGDESVGNVTQRMDCFRKRLGDRFHEMSLGEFVRNQPAIPEAVDLLVLRSTEIDRQLETSPENTLGLVLSFLKQIRHTLHKLRGLGFKDAVIATDHGFFLNASAEAGDVCIKPQGNWAISAHDRLLLGQGNADAHNTVMDASKLGIRGTFHQAAIPKTMAPYRSGHLYFHGGLSLQEAVVPVLVARLDGGEKSHDISALVVNLTYRNGAKRITTRVPVFDLEMPAEGMFALDRTTEILLEAQDSKGNVVGEPRPGGEVNPATRTVTLMPGQRKQVTMRMDPDFEGKFTIKALNPTTLTMFTSIKLETDYTV